MNQDEQTLRVLLLPVPCDPNPWDLLLPGAAVAEIVRAEPLTAPAPRAPDWLIGYLAWRGLQLPVIRLAAPDRSSDDQLRHLQAVVCHAPGGDPSLAFVAIESPGVPRLERVTPESVTASAALAAQEGHPFLQVTLCLRGRPAALVDLDAIERAVLGVLPADEVPPGNASD
ncbi:chemotaxis protein CheW [uncultured Lamprocystis sp.]|jgi:chemosensory pili system protein ChpC|uniref:chemotaxis protein CheW n=1 Tax=uncultured Lamprocystis sp. TaxID=543132 RepID=UPI0025EA7B14|nr:chemotaxis protein CheW [uncultured Lamprocystis sp.]